MQHSALLLLVPRDQPWVAAFSPVHVKVDVTAGNAVDPAARRLSFVDVELDVVWRWDEPARVVDREELDALALPADDHAAVVATAERVRSMADAGVHPFGASSRQRAERLSAGWASYGLDAYAWMAGVGSDLLPYVERFSLEAWLTRQRRGEGWLLAGGVHDEALAVAWVGADGSHELVAGTDERLVRAMTDAASLLAELPPPPL